MQRLKVAPLIALGFAVAFQLAAVLGWPPAGALASTAMLAFTVTVIATMLLDWYIARARRTGLPSRWDVPSPEPAPASPSRNRSGGSGWVRPLLMNGLLSVGFGAWLLLRGFRPVWAAIGPLVGGAIFLSWALVEAVRRSRRRRDGDPT